MPVPRFRYLAALGLLIAALPSLSARADAQEARRRWELMRQIRLDKFDLVLPGAMRELGIDMWITAMREDHYDPLYEDLGRGYPSRVAYYVFTDRGGARVERVAIGLHGYLLSQSGAYDQLLSDVDLGAFVRERDPKRIAVNMSAGIGAADGLSHSLHGQIVDALGPTYAARLVSAERLVALFRSRRVASELVAFGEAARHSIELAERALSNEVITPGKTALEDVAWWLQDRLLERGLSSVFDMPSVYVTGPTGIEATSNDRIVQPGDILMIDWGVRLMNFSTDVKRVAYVLKPGEREVPESIRQAYDTALAVQRVLRAHIRPGRRADETLEELYRQVKAAGYEPIEFNRPNAGPSVAVTISNLSARILPKRPRIVSLSSATSTRGFLMRAPPAYARPPASQRALACRGPHWSRWQSPHRERGRWPGSRPDRARYPGVWS